METEASCNASLRSPEEQVRCQLKDSEARLTQSGSEGRVCLEIQEDLLTNFLHKLSEQKELMQREICSLKARLDEAQAKHIHSSQRDIQDLKSQLRKISKETLIECELQTSNTKDLRVRLEQMRKENEALEKETDDLKVQLHAARQLRAVAENNLNTSTHYLKLKFLEKDIAEFEARSKVDQLEEDLVLERAEANKVHKKLWNLEKALLKQKEEAEATVERCKASHHAQLERHIAEISKITAAVKESKRLLETEHLCLQQEKTSFQEARASYMAQLDEQKRENNKLVAAVMEAEQQLQTGRLQWQQYKSSLLQDLNKSWCTYQAQLEVQKKENSSLAADLKKAEDQWQQEKTSLLEEMETSSASYVDQLDEVKQKNDDLVAAPKQAEQQLEVEHLQWQEDKSSLLQEQQVESHREPQSSPLKQTVQGQEPEPEKPGSFEFEVQASRSRLPDP